MGLQSAALQLNNANGELYLPVVVGRAYRIYQVRISLVGDGTQVSVLISHDLSQTGSGAAIAPEPPVWFFWRTTTVQGGSHYMEHFPRGVDVTGPQFVDVDGAEQVEIRVYYEPIRISSIRWRNLARTTSFRLAAGL